MEATLFCPELPIYYAYKEAVTSSQFHLWMTQTNAGLSQLTSQPRVSFRVSITLFRNLSGFDQFIQPCLTIRENLSSLLLSSSSRLLSSLRLCTSSSSLHFISAACSLSLSSTAILNRYNVHLRGETKVIYYVNEEVLSSVILSSLKSNLEHVKLCHLIVP